MPRRKMSPGQALHRKVLVDLADEDPHRFFDHVVVGCVRDGAAAGDRRQARSCRVTSNRVHEIMILVGAGLALPNQTSDPEKGAASS
ncbi:MAG: hypothetical protein AAB253_06525, partial [candidate division NC10 bacterium]